VAPLNVLRDLHRVRFLALDPPPGGAGSVRASFDETLVSEDWSGGRLLRRRFERPGNARAGEIQVDFDGAETRIDNPGCGYRATWTLMSEEAL
jgi:hypothetical protein